MLFQRASFTTRTTNGCPSSWWCWPCSSTSPAASGWSWRADSWSSLARAQQPGSLKIQRKRGTNLSRWDFLIKPQTEKNANEKITRILPLSSSSGATFTTSTTSTISASSSASSSTCSPSSSVSSSQTSSWMRDSWDMVSRWDSY